MYKPPKKAGNWVHFLKICLSSTVVVVDSRVIFGFAFIVGISTFIWTPEAYFSLYAISLVV